MGAVRVKVRLTNGVDESPVRSGQLRPEEIPSYGGDPLVDTGAMDNVIPAAVMKQPGLTAVERTRVRYADGHGEVSIRLLL